MAFETEVLEEGFRWSLPRRELGPLKWIAYVLIGAGLLFVGGTQWILGDGFSGSSPDESLFSTLFTIPFALMGLLPAVLGMTILKGRTEIEVSGDRLVTRERLGVLSWSRRRSLEHLKGFKVYRAPPEVRGSGAAWTKSGILVAELHSRKPLMLALMYDADLLTELADQVADRVGTHSLVAVGTGTEAPARPQVDVVESLDDHTLRNAAGAFSGKDAPLEPPAGSDLHVERQGDKVVVELPPTGFKKSAGAVFFFGVIWTLFVSGFAVALLSSSNAHPLPAWAFLSLFLSIGVGMLLGGLNMARRRAMIGVIPGGLVISRVSLFSEKQHDWHRSLVKTVEVKPSGMTVNNRTVYHLVIALQDEKDISMFAGRETEELRYVAGLINRELGLEASAVSEPVSEPVSEATR